MACREASELLPIQNRSVYRLFTKQPTPRDTKRQESSDKRAGSIRDRVTIALRDLGAYDVFKLFASADTQQCRCRPRHARLVGRRALGNLARLAAQMLPSQQIIPGLSCGRYWDRTCDMRSHCMSELTEVEGSIMIGG
jgi:hypothetical protein